MQGGGRTGYLVLKQHRGVAQEIQDLGQRQGQGCGHVTTVMEHHLQQFAAQEVAIHAV